MLASSVADLDWLASISQPVDLIKDNAVVLVALGHVCASGQVNVLPTLLQNDLTAHTIDIALILHNKRQDQTQAQHVLDPAVSNGVSQSKASSGAPLLTAGFGAAAVLCAVFNGQKLCQRHRPEKLA